MGEIFPPFMPFLIVKDPLSYWIYCENFTQKIAKYAKNGRTDFWIVQMGGVQKHLAELKL